MIYTPLTNKAMRLAYAAHQGQTDQAGLPYIFHPFHLAEQMDGRRSASAPPCSTMWWRTPPSPWRSWSRKSPCGHRRAASADPSAGNQLF